MENSIERIVPDMIEKNQQTGDESLKLHMDRYHFAGKHLLKGIVADIACGAGYGSYLLATQYGDKVLQVIAVDNDESSISYAKSRYAHPNITFVKDDITKFIPHIEFQNIVCLETLEHLPNPYRFVNHIAQYLQIGGLFIVSVPITPSMDANPFHLHDFTERTFKRLFADAGFKEVELMRQVQPFNLSDVLFKKEKRTENMRKNILRYYVARPAKFFLRIKSLLIDGFQNKYIVAIFQKQRTVT